MLEVGSNASWRLLDSAQVAERLAVQRGLVRRRDVGVDGALEVAVEVFTVIELATPLEEHLALVWSGFDENRRALVAWEEFGRNHSLGRYQAGYDEEGRLLAREQLTPEDTHDAALPAMELP